MNLFILLVLSWMLGGLLINISIRALLKTRLKSVMYIANETDYTQGYTAGITNVKMYYYTIGEIPSTHWLDKVQHTILDSREKLEATIENMSVKQ